MKILVIGAGATYAEALHFGIRKEFLPPLMRNLAAMLWNNFNPHPYLDRYLESLGYVVKNEDGRKLFYRLEKKGKTNIEQFFEFCWQNREKSWSWSDNPAVNGQKNPTDKLKLPCDFKRGMQIHIGSALPKNVLRSEIKREPVSWWDNMMNHGFGDPFISMMGTCFFENGTGFKNFKLSQKIIQSLEPGDIVLNLNYDTIFEIALQQSNIPYIYSNDYSQDSIIVCKPHGSLNMVINHERDEFCFGSPQWLGNPQPEIGSGFHSFSGLIPPRSNKSYQQNPVSKKLIDSIRFFNPESIVFWGVGFTGSDVDLIDLFKSYHCRNIEVINPDKDTAIRIGKILSCKTFHFENVDAWEVIKKDLLNKI